MCCCMVMNIERYKKHFNVKTMSSRIIRIFLFKRAVLKTWKKEFCTCSNFKTVAKSSDQDSNQRP